MAGSTYRCGGSTENDAAGILFGHLIARSLTDLCGPCTSAGGGRPREVRFSVLESQGGVEPEPHMSTSVGMSEPVPLGRDKRSSG